jgi:hypothetical protein
MSTGEVTAFLETIGLEHYASALINTGFYTSVTKLDLVLNQSGGSPPKKHFQRTHHAQARTD